MARRGNIKVLRDHLDDAALSALYAQADALLSLHRAEGFGLPMLEALARGIPVVATAWSGNMDFTGRGNSVDVPYRLVPVRDPAAIYHGGCWAEPDIVAAAAGLRRLADDAEFYDRLAGTAHRGVAEASKEFPLTDLAQASAA